MDYPVLGQPPNVATGVVPHHLDASGRAVPVAAADGFANVTATGTVKSGAGVLSAIVVNNPGTTVTATLYDHTSATGTKIGTVALVAGMNLRYGRGIAFGTGLHIVLSGAADLTVCFR